MAVEAVLTPRVNANDSDALVVRWLVETLERVEAGRPVCEIETTKATVEVTADAAGHFFPIVAIGDRVQVGQRLALLLPAPDPSLAAAAQAGLQPAGGATALVSEPARALMAAHALTAADFTGLAVIRKSDVEALVASRVARDVTADLDALRGGPDAVVLYGAGRHGLVVLDTLLAGGRWRPVAFIDDHATRGQRDLPLFRASHLAQLAARGVTHAHVSMGDASGVAQAIEQIDRAGLTLINAIHPSAVVSPLARLGRGVFVGPLVIVGPDAEIGDAAFLNNGCSVAHHCVLAPQVILADGARLGGAVRVGTRTLIGINATVNKDVTIGERVTVVSGAVVFDHVKDGKVIRADGSLHELQR